MSLWGEVAAEMKCAGGSNWNWNLCQMSKVAGKCRDKAWRSPYVGRDNFHHDPSWPEFHLETTSHQGKTWNCALERKNINMKMFNDHNKVWRKDVRDEYLSKISQISKMTNEKFQPTTLSKICICFPAGLIRVLNCILDVHSWILFVMCECHN